MAPAAVSFGACVCSWLFAWHVAWLSAMQLRHYLFIGTLNPLLDHLARGDQHLGTARGGTGQRGAGDTPGDTLGSGPALTPCPSPQ